MSPDGNLRPFAFAVLSKIIPKLQKLLCLDDVPIGKITRSRCDGDSIGAPRQNDAIMDPLLEQGDVLPNLVAGRHMTVLELLPPLPKGSQAWMIRFEQTAVAIRLVIQDRLRK